MSSCCTLPDVWEIDAVQKLNGLVAEAVPVWYAPCLVKRQPF